MKDPKNLILGIDQGNANIKTSHCIFPANFIVSCVDPGISDNTLKFNEKFYTLINAIYPSNFDKTTNEKYYILTLAAIAKELIARKLSGPAFDIDLGLGLPPGLLNASTAAELKTYISKNKSVDFECNGISYHINIAKICVFPQGLSALYADAEKEIYDLSKASCMVIDIGGGMTDFIVLKNGKFDLNLITSEPYGTINFTLQIQRSIMKDFRLKISEDFIRGVMLGEDGIMFHDKCLLDKVRSMYEIFATNIYNTAQLFSPEDLAFTDVFLTGGGAKFFTNFFKKLENEKKIKSLYIQDNICSNAIGYELMMGYIIKNADLLDCV